MSTPNVGETRDFYVFHSDPYRGRVWTLITAVIESVNASPAGAHGMAVVPGSGGFDWHEYSDGKLCHGRRYAAPIEANRAQLKSENPGSQV